jgi:multidrug resistance efflux pump
MTPEQVEQAKAAVQAIGGELDAEARAQRFRQALAGVLTAEQQAKYDSIRARFAQVRYGTVWIQAPDGKLEPRRVKLGISDSKTTEVEAERLKAGDVVVLRAREVTS